LSKLNTIPKRHSLLIITRGGLALQTNPGYVGRPAPSAGI